jgi:uncharacterized oxidoreductase
VAGVVMGKEALNEATVIGAGCARFAPALRPRLRLLSSISKEKIVDLSKNEVLVTGGGSGIGLGLAEKFLAAGSTVIVCGRRKNILEEVRKKHPGLITYPCDLAREAERDRLAEWIETEHPHVNVLVNNAGIQQRIGITQKDFWARAKQEVAINWEAPIHLTTLLLETLKKAPRAFILNVTSGLAFVPMASAPIYCATKAAMHSFTWALRPMLAGSSVQVIEIIPPAVNTDLGGVGLHTTGTPLEEFISSVAQQLQEGKMEITYGFSEKMSRASREELEQTFQRMNGSRS